MLIPAISSPSKVFNGTGKTDVVNPAAPCFAIGFEFSIGVVRSRWQEFGSLGFWRDFPSAVEKACEQ
jgi:hypothetical protein